MPRRGERCLKQIALQAVDASRLYAIDAAASSHPWRASQYRSGLAADEFGWGLEQDGSELVAFAVFQQVLDEATLLNLAVAPAWQRRGMASTLLRAALRACAARGAARCLLEVRQSNAAALRLYETLGFVRDGVRPNYYPAPQGREAAVLMSASLMDASLMCGPSMSAP